MVKFYFQNVVAGKRKVTQVPKSLLQGVLDMLEANGYVINDDGTVSKKQQKTTGVASATLFLEGGFYMLDKTIPADVIPFLYLYTQQLIRAHAVAID